MVVQHNLTAMNSNRLLGLTTASQAKSTEKLSSGYKINRAADDASGLSISEKMRKQIRGLTQASTNAQDGISAVQTAEGALAEVHDMLQRMNELAVKSANGTNSEDDRQNIQDEISQLVTEIDRVAETTKFNETYLLKGDITQPLVDELKYGTVTRNAPGTATISTTVYDIGGNSYAPGSGEAGLAALLDGANPPTIYNTKPVVATSNEITIDTDGTLLSITGSVWDDAGNEYKTATINAAKAYFDGTGNKLYTTDISATTTTSSSGEYTYTPGAATAVDAQLYDIDGNKIAANGLQNYIEFDANGVPALKADKDLYTDDKGTKLNGTDLSTYVTKSTTAKAALDIDLHVGADATANNQIEVKLEAMSAKGIGIDQLKVTGKDDKNSLDAIDTIKAAIQRVSNQRSMLGAAQNRLEHTITNLDNIVENTTAAEAEIRDTDMATEMVKYSNNNILAQAGQSMLAQANQGNQGVLSLLG